MKIGLTNPAVFRLVRDPQMQPEVMENDLVLVDRSHSVRHSPDADSMYLVAFEGSALIRYVRCGGPGICLLTADTRDRSELWPCASLYGRDILEVIRGRIVWIGRQMETPSGSVDKTGPGIGSSRRAG